MIEKASNFRIAKSKQAPTEFFWCPDPVTIDKSGSWGAGNFQQAPNGAFLKWDEKKGRISHLVQPNADKTAPIGWKKSPDGDPFLFVKSDIAVIQKFTPPRCGVSVVGELSLKVHTRDGVIEYEVREPSYLVCNLNGDDVDLTDCWVIAEAEFDKNYTL